MPAKLAPHLSHKSALALLPPSSIAPPIEAVRRVHDRHFARWPPHINLIYPFLASPTEDELSQGDGGDTQEVPCLKQTIRSRINEAVTHMRPFHVKLSADPPGVFSHNQRSKTVWLAPSSGPIDHLQAALQAEFSECDSDSRTFTPHLSVGQARSDASAQKLGDELKRSVSGHSSDSGDNEYQLDWLVDKICVIERKGFHGRFKVVEAIELRNE
jgi:2'-5' RNA ligase